MKKNHNHINRTAAAQKREKSCGAIVYRREGGKLLYLILQQKSHHWSFPKGHVERGETEQETALREIREETGLCVSIGGDFRTVNRFPTCFGSIKDVVYFLAEADSARVCVQPEEILSSRWCSFDEAQRQLTFSSDREILRKAHTAILNSLAPAENGAAEAAEGQTDANAK